MCMEDKQRGSSLIDKRIISVVYGKLKERTAELLVPITVHAPEAKAINSIYVKCHQSDH